jgi:hypothetical protein
MCCSAAGRPTDKMPWRPHLATLWSTLCTRLRQTPGAALSKSITASLTAAAARRAAPSPLAASPACAAQTDKEVKACLAVSVMSVDKARTTCCEPTFLYETLCGLSGKKGSQIVDDVLYLAAGSWRLRKVLMSLSPPE